MKLALTIAIVVTALLLLILSRFVPLGNAPSDSDELVFRERRRAANEICRRYQLVQVADGWVNVRGDLTKVQKLNLGFVYSGDFPIQEARQLVIQSVEDFLSLINSVPELEPHFSVHPLTHENLLFMIRFCHRDGRPSYAPNVTMVTVSRGKVIYDLQEEGQPFRDSNEITEPYEEALRIVRRQDELSRGDMPS